VQLTSLVDANGCVLANPAPYGATVVVYEELTLSCPADIAVNTEPGSCDAEVTFGATTGGEPTPTLTYSIEGSPISSPHSFPLGTTTVDVEWTNNCATLNCSFTVVVTDIENPIIECATPAA